MFEYFFGGGSNDVGIRELSVGVSLRFLTSFSSVSSEVVLHRYLTLVASF